MVGVYISHQRTQKLMVVIKYNQLSRCKLTKYICSYIFSFFEIENDFSHCIFSFFSFYSICLKFFVCEWIEKCNEELIFVFHRYPMALFIWCSNVGSLKSMRRNSLFFCCVAIVDTILFGSKSRLTEWAWNNRNCVCTTPILAILL